MSFKNQGDLSSLVVGAVFDGNSMMVASGQFEDVSPIVVLLLNLPIEHPFVALYAMVEVARHNRSTH